MSAPVVNVALRDYQQQAVDDLFAGIDAGHKRQILGLATGAGKTECAAAIIARLWKSGLMPPNSRPYFVAERITLVMQAAMRFERLGFAVGVLQGDASTPRTFHEHVVVASIQSLTSRFKLAPHDMGAILIDEVHICHRRHVELLTALDNIVCVGLSATPLRFGLGRLYSNLVRGPSTGGLIGLGYLVPSKCYAPSKADLSGVQISKGDYNLTEAWQQMKEIIGDVVSHWQRLGENRQTICFACNIAHAQALAEDFRAVGVVAEVIHHKVPRDEVASLIRRFESGDVRILVSITKLATGFDSPAASCAIVARPTLSEALHVQMVGRVLRPYPGKVDALILDHAGNLEQFGTPESYVLPDSLDDGELEQRAASKRRDLPEFRVCPECTAVCLRTEVECPACGHAVRRPDSVIVVDGKLVAMGGRMAPQTAAERLAEQRQFFAELRGYAGERNYKSGFASMKFRERHGRWPPWDWQFDVEPAEPTPATRRWLRSRMIAWTRAKERGQRV